MDATASSCSGRSQTRRVEGPGAAQPTRPLPCLDSNNSITDRDLSSERTDEIPSPYHARVAFALGFNVEALARRHGLARVGFLTLTFADHVVSIAEAQRRFNSLGTNVLSARYLDSIRIVERQKSSRVHFHLVVAMPEDIRTGFNFEEAAAGVYRSANDHLRSEWAFWRETAPRYGFGRTELLPVRSNEEAIGRYIGKYIGKHIMRRTHGDKGARLVRYSEGARAASVRFSWNTDGMWYWRLKLARFAADHGITDYSQLSPKLGRRWAWSLREQILSFCEDSDVFEEAWAAGKARSVSRCPRKGL